MTKKELIEEFIGIAEDEMENCLTRIENLIAEISLSFRARIKEAINKKIAQMEEDAEFERRIERKDAERD